jgi:hypothetical protein
MCIIINHHDLGIKIKKLVSNHMNNIISKKSVNLQCLLTIWTHLIHLRMHKNPLRGRGLHCSCHSCFLLQVEFQLFWNTHGAHCFIFCICYFLSTHTRRNLVLCNHPICNYMWLIAIYNYVLSILQLVTVLFNFYNYSNYGAIHLWLQTFPSFYVN